MKAHFGKKPHFGDKTSFLNPFWKWKHVFRKAKSDYSLKVISSLPHPITLKPAPQTIVYQKKISWASSSSSIPRTNTSTTKQPKNRKKRCYSKKNNRAWSLLYLEKKGCCCFSYSHPTVWYFLEWIKKPVFWKSIHFKTVFSLVFLVSGASYEASYETLFA